MKLKKRIEDIFLALETVFEEELTEEGQDAVKDLMDELKWNVEVALAED